ncbi:DUF302 domain-containing protein [Nocardia amikacinitolerans]|uniref:DUF302 domain-containing protein n=1 Tax=Nocardia amikacinitolerans TaxID=756689 RepID=UPI0036B9B7C8
MRYQVGVDQQTPQTVLELRRGVRAEHAGEDIGAGLRALQEFAAVTGLAPAGPASTTYVGDFTPGAAAEVVFTLPIAAASFEPDTGEISLQRTEPGLFAHTIHHGDYQRIGEAYRALEQWLRAAQYRVVGPPTEVYLVGPDEAVAAHDLLTQIRVPVAAAPLTVRTTSPFTDTVIAVRTALTEHGFAVLNEVDMRAALQEAADAAMENYVILGTCHPQLAARALAIDRGIGLLLPWNVVVRADGDTTVVEAGDPQQLLARSGHTALAPIADQARRALRAVLDQVATSSSPVDNAMPR